MEERSMCGILLFIWDGHLNRNSVILKKKNSQEKKLFIREGGMRWRGQNSKLDIFEYILFLFWIQKPVNI